MGLFDNWGFHSRVFTPNARCPGLQAFPLNSHLPCMGLLKPLSKLLAHSSIGQMKASTQGFKCRFSGSKYTKDFRVYFGKKSH